MWVIFTHDVTNDTGAFLIRFVWLHAGFVHAVDDATLNWLEAVADVRDRTSDDDGHRVVKEGGADFRGNIAVD